jgi:uncharacterized protein YfaA (DUF2138 family)
VIDGNVEAVRSEQRDKRQDLSAMAISYSSLLKNNKTSIPENEFHLETRKPVRKNIVIIVSLIKLGYLF